MAATVAFVDGYDHYPSNINTAGYGLMSTYVQGFISGNGVSLATGLNGVGFCLQIDSTSVGGEIRRAWGVENAKISHGFAMKIRQLGSGNQAILRYLNNAGNSQFVLGLSELGMPYVTGEGGTILAYAPVILNINVRYFWEVYADLDAGTFVLKIQGIERINLAGVDIRDSTGNVSACEWPAIGTFSGGDGAVTKCSFDDQILIYDEIYPIGEIEVFTSNVASDTADSDWVPLSGSDNYAMVDEARVDGDTTYNTSNTPGDLDLFDFPDLAFVPDYVVCFSVVNCAKKEASSTRTIKGAAKVNGTIYYGADYNLSNDWTYDYYHSLKSPDTLLEWTFAEINGTQTGYELVL